MVWKELYVLIVHKQIRLKIFIEELMLYNKLCNFNLNYKNSVKGFYSHLNDYQWKVILFCYTKKTRRFFSCLFKSKLKHNRKRYIISLASSEENLFFLTCEKSTRSRSLRMLSPHVEQRDNVWVTFENV